MTRTIQIDETTGLYIARINGEWIGAYDTWHDALLALAERGEG